MKYFRKSNGFTLMELMVTILVASIVTLSATTILLLGVRIMHKSNDTAERQYNTRVLLTSLESLAAEGTITEVRELPDDEGIVTGLQIYNGAQIVYSYDAETDTVYTGAGDSRAALLTNVEEFSAEISGRVLTFKIKSVGEEPYETAIYCRMTPYGPGSDTTGTSLVDRLADGDNILDLGDSDTYIGRNAFLKALASQYGSVGVIKGGDDAGKYFSEWYIGSYEGNEGWNTNTPWCACYVSWAAAQQEVLENLSGSERPRYANVESFRQHFVGEGGTGNWIAHTTATPTTATPTPGDLIFFNLDEDPEADHMGVVLAYTDQKVYTIEGNSYNKVRIRDYILVAGHPDNAEDMIMGYGVLNWQ